MKKKKYIYIYICHTMIGKIQNMHNKQDREKKRRMEYMSLGNKHIEAFMKFFYFYYIL